MSHKPPRSTRRAPHLLCQPTTGPAYRSRGLRLTSCSVARKMEVAERRTRLQQTPPAGPRQGKWSGTEGGDAADLLTSLCTPAKLEPSGIPLQQRAWSRQRMVRPALLPLGGIGQPADSGPPHTGQATAAAPGCPIPAASATREVAPPPTGALDRGQNPDHVAALWRQEEAGQEDALREGWWAQEEGASPRRET